MVATDCFLESFKIYVGAQLHESSFSASLPAIYNDLFKICGSDSMFSVVHIFFMKLHIFLCYVYIFSCMSSYIFFFCWFLSFWVGYFAENTAFIMSIDNVSDQQLPSAFKFSLHKEVL